MVVIKVTFNNDIRRITIDESQAFSYKDLRSLLKKIHHNALPTHFEIKYLDDENDKVTISSDRELAEALHFVRTAKQPLLRLVLSEPVKKSTPATAPAPAEADSAKGKEREQPHQQEGAFSPAQLLAVLESALNSPEVQQTWDVVQGTFTTCLDQAVREGRTAAHYVQQHPQFARAQELLTERLPQAIHNDLNTTLPQLLSDIQGIFANLAVPTAPPAPSSSSSSSGSLPVRHHAICDACDSQIVGIRYKCTTCPDYDLCEKCEAKQPSVHDATHYFIKLRSQLPWGLEGNVRLATAPQPQGSTSPLSRASRCPYFQPQQHHQPAQQPQQPSSDRTGPQFQGPRPGWRKVHPCRFMLSARFISDVSIADGTVLEPNTPFVKIWRLRNDGERAWPEGTTLAYIFGQRLAAVDAVAVPALAAGEEVDIAVEMVAPAEPGHYVSNWRLTGPRGYKFGHRVWVDINVAAEEKPKAEEPKVEAEAAAEPTVEEPASESEEEAFEVLELPKKEEEEKEETVQEPQESSKVVHIVIEEAPAPTTTVPAVVAEEKKEEEEKKPQAPVDDDEPEAVRAVLEQLAQMGFPDRALNKRTLLRNKGNVLATVHKLLGL